MKKSVIDFGKTLTCYDSSTNSYSQRPITDEERANLIREKNKLPGEFGFDSRIFVARSEAERFDRLGYYTDAYEGSIDFRRYWDNQKKICYTGLLIDEKWYITGDLYWYLNFIQIPNKVEKKPTFPWILDTDVWWFGLIELSKLENKFSLTLKKRQIGVSLKLLAKMLKRFWFEKGFVGKVSAWDDNYLLANWRILEGYKDFLNEYTGWYRKLDPDSKFYWMQKQKFGRSYKGNKSVIAAINTKANPGALVSGKTDEAFIDEAGENPTLDASLGVLEPAMRFGNIITGEVHVAGAVGKLQHSGPLQEYFFKPDSMNFLSMPNIWSKRPGEEVGIFIPESYSYGNFIDEFGNSLVEEAHKHIEKEQAKIKEKSSFKAWAIAVSQAPLTPEDCFNIREKNIFPTDIIKPHYDYLKREYNPQPVTLYERNGKVLFDYGSNTPMVTDYPVKKDTLKDGAVIIHEPPIVKDPPYGLYYAAVDPIKNISTDLSSSLMSVYIYKAVHDKDDQLAMDMPVAWYTGRHQDPHKTFEVVLFLCKLYNARVAVENDQPAYIEWLIGRKETNMLMRRSDMPILVEWVPKSQIREEYGWRTGSGNSTVKDKLFETLINYCSEVIGYQFNPVTGESEPIYGVTRIMDIMALEEMIMYSGGNADRLIALAGVLMAARSNTNRGIRAKVSTGPSVADLDKVNRDHKKVQHNALGNRKMKPRSFKLRL